MSNSGWIRATLSLHEIQFPRADNFSSTFAIFISGRFSLRNSSSSSVVDVGTIKPFLFPAINLPIILVPPKEIYKTGIFFPTSFLRIL